MQPNHSGMIIGVVFGTIILGVAGFTALAFLSPDVLKKDTGNNFPFRTSNSGPVEVERRALDEFPVAESTAFATYAKDDTIPMNELRAYYFNTNTPTEVLQEETVDQVMFSFAWEYDYQLGKSHDYSSEKPTIKSEDFGGYWVGQFTLDKGEERDLVVENGWSDVRVRIDGKEVYNGQHGGTVPLRIPAGTHLIEVELANNWHTADLSVSIDAPKPQMSSEQVRAALRDIPVTNIWYTGIYESTDVHRELRLVAAPTEPTVLFLSSYAPTTWDLEKITGGNLKAVVVASVTGHSRVVGIAEDVLVHHASFINAYDIPEDCDDLSEVACTNSAMSSVRQQVSAFAGKNPTGFTGVYSAAELTIPARVLR